ncbi:vesicle-associated membrane protein-associated protein A-like isoform X2 [Xenia sp. Carnegie-2017]|uniref:vesicle-associated membrane protein-associated protein A-like isoform X2 n=1 Tax=Xenia sp. Carnegie-2017 TaxID=2897299 RepID=UPI001F033659|nr:vesicle-associated membrane protein-associated protein A-like isoform X2 [Xenia sp. Carnegie-2017]
MSKQEQILEIDPAHELHFKGPFNKAVNCNIVLRNPTEKRVCFKVKTTAPKKYCVRPNSGIIDPRSKVSVAVMLQPFDFDVKEKSRHKFMVQSIIILENTDNMDNIWKEAKPDQIMDSKLKCIFDPADDETSENEPTEKNEFASTLNNMEQSSENEASKVEEVVVNESPSSPKEADIRQRSKPNKIITSSPEEIVHNLQSAANEYQLPPVVYLIVAVILGFIIGKFIL